jgi:hypothetical protein
MGKTPPIKALREEATKDLELSLIPFLDISMYRARNILIVSYVLSDLTSTIHLPILKQKFILILDP